MRMTMVMVVSAVLKSYVGRENGERLDSQHGADSEEDRQYENEAKAQHA